MKGLEYGGSICILYLYMMLVKIEEWAKEMVTYFQNLQKVSDTYSEILSLKEKYQQFRSEKLRRELKPHVNTNLDSVILFKSRSEKWLDKEFWGKEDDLTSFIV